MVFIDSHKAFDSIETMAFLRATNNARIDTIYTKTLLSKPKLIKTLRLTKLSFLKMSAKVTISKLFTLALEDVYKKINWESIGLRADGYNLNRLRLVDDTVFMRTSSKKFYVS